jgi:hypothetical protein
LGIPPVLVLAQAPRAATLPRDILSFKEGNRSGFWAMEIKEIDTWENQGWGAPFIVGGAFGEKLLHLIIR